MAAESFLEARNSGYENIWSEYIRADIKPYKQFIDDNYQYLLEHDFKSELEAIQRLLEYKLK